MIVNQSLKENKITRTKYFVKQHYYSTRIATNENTPGMPTYSFIFILKINWNICNVNKASNTYFPGLAAKFRRFWRHSFNRKGGFLFPILVFCIPTQEVKCLCPHFLCMSDLWLWYGFLACPVIIVSEDSWNIFLWFLCCLWIILPFYFILPDVVEFFLPKIFFYYEDGVLLKVVVSYLLFFIKSAQWFLW